MQELIEWTEKYEGKMISADQVLLKAHKFLEKEKEQIIYARIDGDENYSIVGSKRYEYAEQYYIETYNQNK